MNTETTTPEVHAFVTRVRELLHDLTVEERRELTDGLEADLLDQVSDAGPDTLLDPDDYARELRLAAGFAATASPVPGSTRGPGVRARLTALLDAAGDRWERAVSGLPGRPWEFLVSLRPAWWVVRAWVAVELVDLVWDRGGLWPGLSLVPSLAGWGLPLLVVAILLSVLLGRGVLWPSPRHGVLARVVLLALNVLAVLVLPAVLSSLVSADDVRAQDSSGSYQEGYRNGIEQMTKAGMYVDGRWITNIFPYDAQGRPLVGVQLFDQTGKPVTIGVQANYRRQSDGNEAGPFVPYAWSDGRTTLANVFPLAERLQETEDVQPDAFGSADPPRIGPFPLEHAGRVSLPGVRPGRFEPAGFLLDESR